MYCVKCGKKLENDYKFCPKCGKEVIKDNTDDLYEKVKKFVIENGKVSISLVEKEFKISKAEASKIIDELEKNGVVSALKGRKREVLISNVNNNKNSFDEKVKNKVKEVMDTEDNTSEFTKEDIDNNIFLALLSYIGIFALIPYFIDIKSKYVKYHAKIGINLLIIEGIYILSDILLSTIKVSKIVIDYGSLVGTRMVTPLFVSVPMSIIGLILTILSIIGIINVCTGKAKELPIIDKIKIIK